MLALLPQFVDRPQHADGGGETQRVGLEQLVTDTFETVGVDVVGQLRLRLGEPEHDELQRQRRQAMQPRHRARSVKAPVLEEQRQACQVERHQFAQPEQRDPRVRTTVQPDQRPGDEGQDGQAVRPPKLAEDLDPAQQEREVETGAQEAQHHLEHHVAAAESGDLRQTTRAGIQREERDEAEEVDQVDARARPGQPVREDRDRRGDEDVSDHAASSRCRGVASANESARMRAISRRASRSHSTCSKGGRSIAWMRSSCTA